MIEVELRPGIDERARHPRGAVRRGLEAVPAGPISGPREIGEPRMKETA